MDYFLYFSLLLFGLHQLVISYDIMCQYGIHLWTRLATKFPDNWVVNTGAVSLKSAIPKFHLPAHILKCHWQFSFNFLKWVARTDGEGVERGWAKLIGLKGSTREMGPGARRDTLEDHMGDSNWKKIIRLGELFRRPQGQY